MSKIKLLFAAGIAAFVLNIAAPAAANPIIDIVNGFESGFGNFSTLHRTTSYGGMVGDKVARLARDTSTTSRVVGTHFEIYTLLYDWVPLNLLEPDFAETLPVRGKMRLSGDLDFDTTGLIIGTLTAVFDYNAMMMLRGQGLWGMGSETEFTFMNIIYGVTTDVPSPNTMSEDRSMLSLWGADTPYNPYGTFQVSSQGLGIDLVIRIPEPGSLGLLIVGLMGLFGFGALIRRRTAAAAVSG